MITIAVAQLTAGCALAIAQAPDPPSPQPASAPSLPSRVIEASLRFSLENGPQIGGISFSEDGRKLYVLIYPETVNIWRIASYWWPEFAAAVTALVLLFAGGRAWRAWRRPQIAGKPHCRRCNYCLHGIAGDRCPECGLTGALQRARRGCSFFRRIAVPVLLVAALLAFDAWTYFARVPRHAPGDWWQWWSDPALTWGKEHGFAWITDHRQPVNRIVEVDIATGRIVRTVRSQSGRRGGDLIGAPDRKTLLLSCTHEGLCELWSIDARSGAILRSTSFPYSQSTGECDPFRPVVAGFTAGGRIACINRFEHSRSEFQLLTWNLDTGELRQAFEAVADWRVDTLHEGQIVAGWRFYGIPSETTGRFLQAPTLFEPIDRWGTSWGDPYADFPGQSESMVRDLASNALETRFDADFGDTYNVPVFDPAGQRFYCGRRRLPDAVYGWSLATGEQVLALPPPSECSFTLFMPDYDPQHRRLFVPFSNYAPHGDGILVADVQQSTWLARLPVPPDRSVMDLQLAPDGRSLAVELMEMGDPTRLWFYNELLIYDLTQLRN